jgi:hypothetical protein
MSSTPAKAPVLGAAKLQVPVPISSAEKRKRSSPEPRLEKRAKKSAKVPTIDLTSEVTVMKRPKAKSADILSVKEVSAFTVQSASRLYDTTRLCRLIAH